jgi:hypothetical protein
MATHARRFPRRANPQHMMYTRPHTLTPAAIVAGLAISAGALLAAPTHTWTGGAGAGSDWFDTANWDGGVVPVLNTNQYGSQTSTDHVVWDSETAVGNYMPSGTITPAAHWPSNSRMPNTELRNGTLTIGQSINWGHTGDTFIIGDGDATNTATVNVNWSNLNRDPNGTKSYVVNSDGTLNITTNLSKFSDSGGKDSAITINGGSVVVSGSINANFIDDSGDYVSFEAFDSSFTANFGGQLPDLATITAQFGDSFRLGGALTSDPDAQLSVIDNMDGSFTVTAATDTDAPTPDPMTFAVAPTAVDTTTVGMVATTADDPSGPVEYFFENITNTDNSGWITDPSWSNTGLTNGVSYDFRVKARDSFENETGWSTPASAAPGNDVTPPSPNPMSFASPPTATGPDSITMTATTAGDINGVQYLFDCLTPGGNDSPWQDSPTYTDTGLAPGTEFTYQVQARDKSTGMNATAFSDPASATTDTLDETPPSISSLSPSNGTSGVPVNANLEITFDEDVAVATGFITLKNLTAATQEQIDVTDNSQVSVDGAVLTINPTSDLLLGNQYAVQIDADAIEDLADTPNGFAGIDNDTTWSFTAYSGIFTWTGGAGAGSDWFDAGNWDGGAVPVLNTNQYGSQTSTDQVIWDSETAVGNYMPSGTITPAAHWPSNSRMPNTELRNGTLTIGQTINWGHNGNTFVIGDGDATNTATVNVNWSNLNRDPNGTKSYVVNSDGILNVTTSLGSFSDGGAKDAVINIIGGAVVVSGTINTNLIDDTGDYISFEVASSTFTANFGGQLPDLGTISAQFGDSFRIGGALASDPGAQLVATDNGDGSFTVGITGPAIITSFEAAGATGVIDQTAKTIEVEVPFGTDLETLAPTFTLTSGTCDPESGSAPSPTFAAQNPATYTVTDTATDPDTVNTYSVTVTEAPETDTLVIDLGTSPAGTTIEGGTFSIFTGDQELPTNLPLPSLPAGSILQKIEIAAALEATDNGNYASDLSLLLDPTPGTPGGDFSVEITNGTTPLGGAALDLDWPASADAGVGTALTETKTDADWMSVGDIDLSTTGLFLGNAFGGPTTGGTWSGKITLTYEVGSGGGGTFSDWIAGYPGVGGQTALGDDPDGDGNDNGVENYFGTDPSVFSTGLSAGVFSTDGGNTFTFTHPLGDDPASDVSAAYRWSDDLATFYPDGDPNGAGTTTVSFQQGVPSGGMVAVTATITGTVIPERLFVDIEVTQE